MDGTTNPERFKSSVAAFKENYGKVLDSYLPAEIRKDEGDKRILSVACGFGLELVGLQQLFPNAYIEAVDNAPEAVNGARAWNPDFPKDRIRLADAAERENFGSTPWDLIVVRNPKTGPVSAGLEGGVWAKILKNCFDTLKPNGFLYLTTLSQVEMEAALGYLSQFPLEDKTPNNEPRTHKIDPPIGGSFAFTENYIAVLKKDRVT